MTETRAIAEHGSRIIAALERAWAAIQDQHPDVPDVVIVTGAGSNQKGTPEGYRLRGHHWPERWVLDGHDRPRAPELFIAGELLSAGGRAVVEVMLHEAAHALATRRGIKDTSAAGNRYHNKRFVALAAELGLRGPDCPGQDHRLVGLHPDRPGRLQRPTPTLPPGSTAPGSRSWSTWPARPAPAPAEATAARTRATARPARRRSAADGGYPSSAPASPSPAASSSRPSRSKTARSSAACAAPRSNRPTTARSLRTIGKTALVPHPGQAALGRDPGWRLSPG